VALPHGSGPPTPAAVARALLDSVVAYYAEHADPQNVDAPVPLPDRRLVLGGEPRVVAWDIELGQVHVSYERTFRALDPATPPGNIRAPRRDPANRGTNVRSLTMEVQIVRPAPGLGQLRTLPSEDELYRHGIAVGLDLHHLPAAATAAVMGGALTREDVREARVDLGDAVTLGPSGKVAGVGLAVTVPLL
jgi:hypothetical protein